MTPVYQEIINPVEGAMVERWPIFSEMIGGLRPHEFTIFCGATGSGKTQWLANLVKNLVFDNVRCYVVPVETGAHDFLTRVISSQLKYDFIHHYNKREENKQRLSEFQFDSEKMQNNLKISMKDNRISMEEMVADLRCTYEENHTQVAVLDNLNFFLEPTSASNMLIEFDRVIHEFVMLAKKIPIHIILVMHPKKTESGKIRNEFDIKGSSTAVQEATNVLLMNRLDENDLPDKGNPSTREFMFCKIRRRGTYVGRKFYMDYDGGAYVERNSSSNAASSRFENVQRFRDVHSLRVQE